ncbi:DUF4147 domain-containing protein [Chloroflexia bacterium SDU3-3]|nr:DUF4147 domain-containing protein [Chloroflexia bacterium SDU3-3]
MDYSRLLTDTLRAHPHGETIARVLAAALDAVEPAAAVRAALHVDDEAITIGGVRYQRASIDRVLVVGAGKAGAPMAAAAAQALGGLLAGGAVVVKDGHTGDGAGPITLLDAAHPVPDERGVTASRQIAALLAGAGERDLVLALISGGGSALLTAPAPGVSLADIQQLTALLLGCGASIGEINTLRKHLDNVKGGGLARMAAPARVAALILSDVVGSPLDVIASGPTVADPSTYADALGTLERYGLLGQAPAPVLEHLRRGAAGHAEETPKPGDPALARVQNLIIGSNPLAAQAALAQAQRAGLRTLLLTTYLQGEAREAGRLLAAVAREIAASGSPLPRPACVVLGGETTVTLRGDGLGGRNQELALAAVADMAGLPGVALVTLATDGGDGPTDAAGAVVTGETLARAQALGLDPADHLARNDAYRFFAPLGDLLRPGPTNTNVNDLAFLFAF